MVRTVGRFLFYLSFVSLIVLILWEHSTARGWQEIAEGAQKAQDRATKIAKTAFDRADRCVSEVSKAAPAQGEKAPAAKPASSAPARKSARTEPGR